MKYILTWFAGIVLILISIILCKTMIEVFITSLTGGILIGYSLRGL